jgi:hypothetical protein
MTMTRTCAVILCGLALAACAWAPSAEWATPSFDFFKAKPTDVQLALQSSPPGAEARTSQGLGCRTPCAVTVPATEEFSVSYTLNGYAPQSLTVRPIQVPSKTFSLEGPGVGPTTTLEPNPAFVELQPAGPPPKAAKAAKPPQAAKAAKPPPKKRKPAAPAAAPAATPAQSMQSPFPPPPGGFTPPPGMGR